MYKVNVLGFKKVEYFSTKKNKQITGVELHFAREPFQFEKNNVSGMVVDTLYVSNAHPVYPALNAGIVGKAVELFYEYDGKYNNLVDIKELKTA